MALTVCVLWCGVFSEEGDADEAFLRKAGIQLRDEKGHVKQTKAKGEDKDKAKGKEKEKEKSEAGKKRGGDQASGKPQTHAEKAAQAQKQVQSALEARLEKIRAEVITPFDLLCALCSRKNECCKNKGATRGKEGPGTRSAIRCDDEKSFYQR